MRRILFMVLRCLFYVPTWFYHVWKMGDITDTHTEQERFDYLRKIVKKVNCAGKVVVNGYGMENLPEENGFILFPNHQGLFDMLALIDTSDRPVGVVVKKEAADIILVKQVLRLLRGIAIDRKDIRASMEMINQVSNEVKEGRNYVIFAEGTRSKEGNKILEFKGGTFKSALKAGCPIVPVALIDSFRPFDISSLKKEIVQVHYLSPIYPEQYVGLKSREIAHIVYDEIQKKIDERMG